MSRDSRLDLIRQIENERNSKVLVYFTADTPPFPASIAPDAIRPMYDHLLSFDKLPAERPNIDLFLYSRGGDVTTPWPLITMLREFCEELSILIPFRAHSAATMIALGADKIVMGRKAELGPIDPTLKRNVSQGATNPAPEISVEDVASYLAFMKERANINDQSALTQVVSQLADHVMPLTLGQVNRQYSHTRLVARKLLMSHNTRIEEERINNIVEALSEKMYSHGHSISRREASELGLPVVIPDSKIENLLWDLYLEYEEWLRLQSPINVELTLASKNAERHIEPSMPLAAIESTERLDVYEITALFETRRKIPQNPQVNLSLTLGIAPNDVEKLPEVHQQILQNLMNRLQMVAPQIIQNELTRQSPIESFNARIQNGGWYCKTPAEVVGEVQAQ